MKIECFFKTALKHPTLFHPPQVFLAHQPTCGMLTVFILCFMAARFDKLGHQDSKMVAVQIVRFSKMAFQAIVMFPEQNEGALSLPLGQGFIPTCCQGSRANKLLLLLCSLFCSIGGVGGCFELL